MMIPDNELYYDGYDPYKGMSDEERMKAGCGQVVIFFVMVVVAMFIASMFTSCKTQYVTVPEVHTEHHWHKDSTISKDSTYHEKQTVIRELDSAAMARYGIQLKAAERAWLVQTSELEARLRELSQMTAIRDTVRDSIPVPVPVATQSQQTKRLSWLEELMISIGTMVTVALACAGVFWLINRKFHFV